MNDKLLIPIVLLLACFWTGQSFAQQPLPFDATLQNETGKDVDFGAALAQHNNYLVIGAPKLKTLSMDTVGGAIVYTQNNQGEWVNPFVLKVPEQFAQMSCGYSVNVTTNLQTIRKNKIVIGCPNGKQGEESGVVLVFAKEQSQNLWKHVEVIRPDKFTKNFGKFVGLSQNAELSISTTTDSVLIGSDTTLYYADTFTDGSSANINERMAIEHHVYARIVSMQVLGNWGNVVTSTKEGASTLNVFHRRPMSVIDEPWDFVGRLENTNVTFIKASIVPIPPPKPNPTMITPKASLAVYGTSTITNKPQLALFQIQPGQNPFIMQGVFNMEDVGTDPLDVSISHTTKNRLVVGVQGLQHIRVFDTKNEVIKKIGTYKSDANFSASNFGHDVHVTYYDPDAPGYNYPSSFLVNNISFTGSDDLVTVTRFDRLNGANIQITEPEIQGTQWNALSRLPRLQGTCLDNNNTGCKSFKAQWNNNSSNLESTYSQGSGEFTIQFLNELPDEAIELVVTGTTNDDQQTSIVYTIQFLGEEIFSPQILGTAEFDAYEFVPNNKELIAYNLLLDPTITSLITLTGFNENGPDFVLATMEQTGDLTWTPNMDLEQGIYTLSVTTPDADPETDTHEFSVFIEPDLKFETKNYEKGIRVPTTFTISGTASSKLVKKVNILIDGTQVASSTTLANGSWNVSVTAGQKGDIQMDIELVSEDSFLLEYKNVIVSVVSKTVCIDEPCDKNDEPFQPAEIDTSLCTTTTLPYHPGHLPLGFCLILLGYIFRRRDQLI